MTAALSGRTVVAERFRIHTNLLPDDKRAGFRFELVDSTHPSDGAPVAIGVYRTEFEAANAKQRTQHAVDAGVYAGHAA